MHSPIEQFVDYILCSVRVCGVSINMTASAMSIICMVVMIIGGTGWYVKRIYIVPNVAEYFIETIYLMIRNLLVKNAGVEAARYLPVVLTMFLIVLLSNLIGLIPGFFTVTSQLAITALLAGIVLISVVAIGVFENGIGFLRLFAPSNVNKIMWPLVVPIEIISFFTKHVSLCVRLTVNMIAGHMILKIFAGFISLNLGLSLIIIPMLIILIFLEIFVACIQAYIFTLLMCVYINDVLHVH